VLGAGALGTGKAHFDCKGGVVIDDDNVSRVAVVEPGMAARLTISASRARRYVSASSNMMSIVSQNGPAFLRPHQLCKLAKRRHESDLLAFGAEEGSRLSGTSTWLRWKLIDWAAVDSRAASRERRRLRSIRPFRDRIVHGEVREARRDRAGQLPVTR